jgi:hypothetical protein
MDTIMVSAAHSGRRRRRSFSEELKRRMVAECAEPGASVSAVARKHDVNANLLFGWCRQFGSCPVTWCRSVLPFWGGHHGDLG